MQTGDVLVAAITTPAWTPLFARAATKRIRSGQVITAMVTL